MDLVVGGSGLLGSRIASMLLERGRPVRLLLREGTPIPSLPPGKVEVVRGDLKDPESLRAACAGVERVVTTANSAGRGGEDTVESVEIRGNRNLVRAAAQAGVKRFLFVSALGADPESPVPFLQGKAMAEAAVREGGMEWIILAPTAFMDVWIPMLVAGPALSEGVVTLVGEGTNRHSLVAVEDVAAFALATLEDPEAQATYLPLGGPEGLSFTEVVERLRSLSGRPIELRRVPVGTPLPGLPPVVSELAAGFNFYESVIPMELLASRYGIRQRSADDFLRGFLG